MNTSKLNIFNGFTVLVSNDLNSVLESTNELEVYVVFV